MKFFILSISFFISLTSFAQNDDWTSYGKGTGGGHYSKATEITPENVKSLKNIWTHRSGDYKGGANAAGRKGDG